MKKSRFSIILAIVMLLTTTIGYASELTFYQDEKVEDVTYPQGALKTEIFHTTSNKSGYSLNSTEIMNFEEYIKMNLRNHKAEIDVSMYDMKLGNFIAKVSEYCDELMIATGLVFFDPDESEVGIPETERTIIKWRPVYLFRTQEEDVRARAFVKQEVLKYADAVRELTDDPLGQLLLVHDMLVKDCEYDVDCIDDIETNDNIQSYSAYGFFKNKIAVCQGYAEVFYLIAKELGYDCGFNVSFKIGHVWNYIKVDDEYYQVDMTWNDPIYERTKNPDGSISVGYHTTLADHFYFLCSDELMEIGHEDKDTWFQSMDEKPDCGKRFESEYLFNITDIFTTEFINGKYVVNTTMDRNNGGITLNGTFEADDLHVGPAIFSVVKSNGSNYSSICYFLEVTNGFDLYIGQYEKDKLLYGVKMGSAGNTVGRGSVVGVDVPMSRLIAGCDNFKLFMWNRNGITPLAVPASNI